MMKVCAWSYLCSADIAGCFVSADVLLSGLQSKPIHLLTSCIPEMENFEFHPFSFKCDALSFFMELLSGNKICLSYSKWRDCLTW